MGAKHVPRLESLSYNISCLALTLVAAGRLLAAIVGSPQKPFIRSCSTEIFTAARRGDDCGNLFLEISRLTNYKALAPTTVDWCYRDVTPTIQITLRMTALSRAAI